MNEGELKKRLFPKGTAIYENKIVKKGSGLIVNKNAASIIDDAKKEFPLSEEDFRNNLAWKKKHKISDLQKDLRRIRGWLEEYFGDV